MNAPEKFKRDRSEKEFAAKEKFEIEAIDEANIRQRIDKYVTAIRAKNLVHVMSIFAPDIVSFDIVLPLQHPGAEAKWKNMAH